MEERHVGRAADRMNLTPSAVSHGLGRLRRLLNDPLFLRTPKGVVPTARASSWRHRSRTCWRGRGACSRRRRPSTRRPPPAGSPSAPRTASRRCSCHRSSPGCAHAAPGHRHRRPSAAAEPGRADARACLARRLRPISRRARWTSRSIPSDDIPARFHARTLYEEDFVVALRAGHPLAKAPTLASLLRDAAPGGLADRRSPRLRRRGSGAPRPRRGGWRSLSRTSCSPSR